MEKRLGRGLGSLLADRTAPAAPSEPRSEIQLGQIRPNPFQPRKSFAPGALEELQASIKAHGILQPIVLRPSGSGYELISGERRWRAAQAAGLTTVPAVIREGVTDEAMLELALVENLQRADLDPIEKSRGFQQLIDRGLSQEQVALRVGLQRSTVANHLRLLELSEPVQRAVVDGLLSMGHAKALLGLADEGRQEELCALIVRKGLSVRDTERRVRELQGRGGKTREIVPGAAPAWVRDMEARIRNHLGTKVHVRNGEGYRGQILIKYHGREDLDRILGLLAPRKTF
jgi:ParB family chromosome partitioning protein